MDKKLFDIRTQKILSYSNLMATSSNLVVATVTKDLTTLDVGGAAVTIYQLIKSQKFIKEVKEEFITGRYEEIIMGDESYLYK
ncbi:MAG: hypothetical protein V8S56_02665 [Lachnospiraceae bacterium]